MDGKQLAWVWERCRPKDRARTVGAVLGGLAGTVWFKQQRHLGPIIRALRELLPAGLLEHLAVEGLRRNTLHLRVDSAGHRYELEMLKPTLLAALNEQLSGIYLRDIRLTLGKLDAEDEPGDRDRPAD